MAKNNSSAGSDSRDFYRSFCRWSSDASGAAASIAAGCFAGGLLTVTIVCAGILAIIAPSSSSPRPPVLFSIAACLAIATYASWKRVVSGAIANGALGLAIIAWLCARGEMAIAVVLFVPLVCGPVTAARGVYVLNNLFKRRRGKCSETRLK
jgi:hypothetical protein